MHRLRRQISTTMIGGCVFSLVLSLFCIAGAPWKLLRLIQVEEGLIPLASQYLRIVFSGLIFTFIYNFYGKYPAGIGPTAKHQYIFWCFRLCLIFWGICFLCWCFIWAAQAVQRQQSSVRHVAVFCAGCILRERSASCVWDGTGWYLTKDSLRKPFATDGPALCSRLPYSLAKSESRQW